MRIKNCLAIIIMGVMGLWLVFWYPPPHVFGYHQKNHEKINYSRKNRLKKSWLDGIQKHGEGIKIPVIGTRNLLIKEVKINLSG